ncbi:MAG: 30S ribosomal protein S17 [Phycisphaerales bacterium]
MSTQTKAKTIVRLVGTVASDKGNKTRRVEVEFSYRHAKYGKYLRKRTVLAVHDEKNESKTGDTVEVTPCRRMSGSKSWALSRVVKRGTEVIGTKA